MQGSDERYEYSGCGAHSRCTPSIDCGEEARCGGHARGVQRTQRTMLHTHSDTGESSGVSDGATGKGLRRSAKKLKNEKFVCTSRMIVDACGVGRTRY